MAEDVLLGEVTEEVLPSEDDLYVTKIGGQAVLPFFVVLTILISADLDVWLSSREVIDTLQVLWLADGFSIPSFSSPNRWIRSRVVCVRVPTR